jgi:hypothetical protein
MMTAPLLDLLGIRGHVEHETRLQQR